MAMGNPHICSIPRKAKSNNSAYSAGPPMGVLDHFSQISLRVVDGPNPISLRARLMSGTRLGMSSKPDSDAPLLSRG